MPTRWYNLAARPARPRRRRSCIQAPAAGRPRGPRAAVPDGPDHAGGHRPTSTSRSPARCSTCTGSGGQSRCTARTGWRRALGTPARIYYKYEGVSPAGSHKPNTAVPQAYYNAKAGIKRLTTETGAGQWGTALAFACAQFGLDCEVWQVRASYDQKPYRRIMIETFGGTVHPSPSDLTERRPGGAGDHPDSTGSLGIAISEAVEVAAQRPDHELLARQRAQPRAACTRRSSARRRCCSWPRSARRPTCSSAAPAAGRTSAGSRSRSCARSWPAGWPGDPRRRAGGVPVADAGASTRTTSATPPA